MSFKDTASIAITAIVVVFSTAAFMKYWIKKKDNKRSLKELFVNYHLTRQCNYTCGFCFHTAKTSNNLTLDEAKQGLKMLAEEGLKKINFAGGEPFMVGRGKFLGELLKYCKEELNPIPICSVISNGSMLTDRWCKKYAKYLDIFAVSIDSFNDDVNHMIGRYSKSKKTQTEIVKICCKLCNEYKVPLKINTVVNTFNWEEDMNASIMELNPIRWKVFQCLLVEGENKSTESMKALRDATKFLISDEQFAAFVARHNSVKCLVDEDNKTMRNSYLLLDEQMRFLNCANNKKEPTESILKIGVQQALNGIIFEKDMFDKRGGDFEIPVINSNRSSCDFGENNPELQW